MINTEHEVSDAGAGTVEREDNPQKVAQWIESLMEVNGAALVREKPGPGNFPVVLKTAEHGECVVVDASSVPFIEEALKSREPLSLLGNRGNARIKTAAMTLVSCYIEAGRQVCRLSYPAYIELEFRRNNFRALLRKGLESVVTLVLNGQQQGAAGRLCDLSMTGTRVQFPMRAAGELEAETVYSMTIAFPAGQSVTLEARLCHCEVNLQENLFFGGFGFPALSHTQEKSLWYFVREIEREDARASRRSRELTPSPLFLSPATERAVDEPVRETPYLTHEARYLTETGDFLAGQILQLRLEGDIDGQMLSRQADRLVKLLKADRDEMLFALACLDLSPLVSHSLTVALWLTHIALGIRMPPDKVKAIAATALVHDLGKAACSSELNDSVQTPKRSPQSGHVGLLLSRLDKCRWLSPEIVREVVQQINENLDGSGYPAGLADTQLSQLGKLAAVVDAVDMARRGSSGDKPMTFAEISTHLMNQGEKLDLKWVQFFFRHFGELPVGAFVETESGQQGWIRRRDPQGNCTVLLPWQNTSKPNLRAAGYGITGKALAALGAMREITRPDS